jgi:hypothetical protein
MMKTMDSPCFVLLTFVSGREAAFWGEDMDVDAAFFNALSLVLLDNLSDFVLRFINFDVEDGRCKLNLLYQIQKLEIRLNGLEE